MGCLQGRPMAETLPFMAEWMKRQKEKHPEAVQAWQAGIAEEDNPRAEWRYVETLGSTKHPSVLSHAEREAYNDRTARIEQPKLGLEESKGPTTSAREVMDVLDSSKPRKGMLDRALTGLKEGYLYGSRGGLGFQEHFAGPLHASMPGPIQISQALAGRATWSDILGGFNRGEDAAKLKSYLKKEGLGGAGLIGAHIGNAAAQVGSLWPMRIPWRLDANDMAATYGPDLIAGATGIAKPDTAGSAANASADPTTRIHTYEPGNPLKLSKSQALRRSIALPVAVATTSALNAFSGNIDWGKLADTEEGPRPKGYKAAQADYENPTKTSLYPFALGSALAGMGPRPLDWNRFHQERPEISKERYDNYMEYYYGNPENTPDADFSIANGMIKGTASNLEGAPELRLLGSRVTPMGALAGALAGGATLWAINRALNRPANPVFTKATEPVGETEVNKLMRKKPRR